MCKKLLIAFVALGVIPGLQAAEYQWAPAGTVTDRGNSAAHASAQALANRQAHQGTHLGSSGTWTTTGLQWDDLSKGFNDGSDAPVSHLFSAEDTARFGGAAGGEVILGTHVTLNRLIVSTPGYVLSGADIRLGGGAPAIVASAAVTVSSVVDGKDGLIKSGAGELTLSGNNRYTGLTIIDEGTLRMGSDSALGAGHDGTRVNPGAILEINGHTLGEEKITLAGGTLAGGVRGGTVNTPVEITGRGTFTSEGRLFVGGTAGDGALMVSGHILNDRTGDVFAHAGGTTINAGSLDLYSGVRLEHGPIVIRGGALITRGAGQLGENLAMTIHSGGAWELAGDESIGALSGAGTIVMKGTATTLTVGGDGSSGTFSGLISGSRGRLVKTGTGALTLSHENTYTGGTLVAGGALRLDNPAAMGAGATTVNAGATLDLNGQSPFNPLILAGGSLENHAAKESRLTSLGVTLQADSTLGSAGGQWISWGGGTLKLNGHTLTQSGPVRAAEPTTVAGEGVYRVEGELNGYGRLSWSTAGSLAVGESGLYRVGGAATLHNVSSSAGGRIVAEGALTFNQTGVRTLAGTLAGYGQVTFSGLGETRLETANTYTGGTLLHAGTVIASNREAFSNGSVTLAGGTLIVDTPGLKTGDFTLSRGTLSFAPEGTLTLGANHNLTIYGGRWEVNLASGAERIEGSRRASFSILGGTLDLGGGAIDYSHPYDLITGFGSGSVAGLKIQGYDQSAWRANLNNLGVLSFTPVPEPQEYALFVGGLAALAAFLRRRHRA